ncbi:MAG: FHA domain-containing protein, partial [Tepidisphaeraceae bacterium]
MATSDTLIPGADHAALVPLGSHAGAPPILIKRPLTAIGSRKDAVRVHLDSSTVSKVHCVIVLNDWGCYVHDMGSRTHTWVNGKQVEDADLADGDLLRVGRFEFKYVAPTQVVARTPKPASDHLDVSTLSDPLAMPKRVVQIGRRAGSDLQLDDVKISNIHAILFDCNGMRFIRDLASRTGTWLDGKPIHQEPLYDGASIKLGATTLTYRQTPTEAPAQDRAQGSAATAPLTLQEATPTPNIGLDSAAELELADLGLDELELATDDTASRDTDSNDALADLRRNWQAPARHADAQPAKAPLADTPTDEKPQESSAAAIESPVADVVSDAAPAAPLPLADASSAEPVADLPPELPAAPAEPPAAIEPEPVIPPATADALPLEPLIADSDTEPADDLAAADALELDLEPLPTPESAVNAQPAETAEVSAPPTPAVSQPSDIDVPPPPVAAETVPSPEAALADLELDDLALDDLELDLDDVVEPLPSATLQEAPADSTAETLAETPASAEVEPEVESTPLADATVAADEDDDWADLDQPASDADAGLDLDAAIDTGIDRDLDAEDVDLEPHPPAPDVPAAKVPPAETPASKLPVPELPAAEIPPVKLPTAPTTPAAPFAEPPRPQPKPEPAFEVDAIDLSLDLDQPFETPDDATALAVDFGLDELDQGDEDDVHVGSDTPVVEAAEPSFDYESPTGGLASAARDHTTPGANTEDELEPVDL